MLLKVISHAALEIGKIKTSFKIPCPQFTYLVSFKKSFQLTHITSKMLAVLLLLAEYRNLHKVVYTCGTVACSYCFDSFLHFISLKLNSFKDCVCWLSKFSKSCKKAQETKKTRDSILLGKSISKQKSKTTCHDHLASSYTSGPTHFLSQETTCYVLTFNYRNINLSA